MHHDSHIFMVLTVFFLRNSDHNKYFDKIMLLLLSISSVVLTKLTETCKWAHCIVFTGYGTHAINTGLSHAEVLLHSA